MNRDEADKLARLGFEAFRARALDPSLSRYEKIGAIDSYRRGQEEAIFADWLARLPALAGERKRVLDIGTGCSDLPRMLVDHCVAHQHALVLMDSAEMLSQLPDAAGVDKVPARFPDCGAFLAASAGGFDVVVVYSVLHYVFMEGDVFGFLDAALSLLAPGGALLLGDLPNRSKRQRFFASDAGVRFHQAFMGTDQPPPLEANTLAAGQMDDAVILGLLMRARGQGFDAYVLPQPPGLPMANRREDVLVLRP
jgi:2-polyprenyl-3-methyl-5-hydroxy-6-metoxy-1,4-benzoquinol methylase